MANQHNKELLKRKVNTLKSIMTNPKLSKMIKESLDAPLGSTKRHQSKSIISILKKLGPDGQGGPGPMMGMGMYGGASPMTPQPQNVVPIQTKDPGNIMIFPAAPKFKMKVNGGNSNGYTPKETSNGQGGPGFSIPGMTDPTKLTVGNQSSTPNFSSLNLGSVTSPNPLSSPALNAPKPANSFVTNSYTAPKLNNPVQPNLSNLTIGQTQAKPDTSKVESKYWSFNAQPTSQPTTGLSITGGNTALNSGFGFDYKKFLQDSGILPKPAEAQQTQTPTDTPAVQTPPAGQNTQPPVQQGSVQTQQTQQGQTTQQGSTQGSVTSPYGAISGAVKNNMGPGGFALNAMNDIETLKQLFPGVPEDQLPVGASLSGQIQGLSDALKKEYDLESLRNRMTNLQYSGATLQDNIKSYIRGKDDYVSYVDGLIDETNNSLLKMDMANPEVRSRMENYQKYLTIMKGRQNQRYIDFLNSSINQHNADLENVSTQYNGALEQYNTELKTKATIAQEDYNRLYTTLVDMYNTVEQAPDKAMQRQLLQQQLYNAQAQALIDVTTALGNKNSAKFWEEQSKYKDNILDKDGNVIPNFNLSNAIYQAQQQGYAPEGVLNLTERGMNNTLSTIAPAAAVTTGKAYKDMIADFAAQGGGNVAYTMGTSVINSAGDSISKYVLQNAPTIKDAVASLAPTGMFGGKKPMPSKEQWISEYKNAVDKDFLDSVYDYAQREVAANPAIDFNFLFTEDGKKISNATDEEVANKIKAGITEGWKYEIARAASGI